MQFSLRLLALTFAIVLLVPGVSASLTWLSLNGPHDARMWDISSSPDGRLFVAGERGLYRSMDFGLSWNAVGPSETRFLSVYAVSNEFIVATSFDQNLYRSLDSGLTWQTIDPISPSNDLISSFTHDENHIYAGTVNGVWRSDNQGDTWENYGLEAITVTSLLVSEQGELLAGTGQGAPLYRRSSADDSWMASGLLDEWVWEMCQTASGTIYAAAFDDILESDDGGQSWTSVDNLIRSSAVSIAARGDTILYAGDSGMYISLDNGENWNFTRYWRAGIRGITILPNGQSLVASFQEGVARSFDGDDWFPANDGLPYMRVEGMVAGANGDLVVHDGTDLLSRTPFGVEWRVQRNISQGISTISLGRDFAFWVGTKKESVYLSTNNGLSFQIAGPENRGEILDLHAALDGSVLAIFDTGIVRNSGDVNSWADISFSGQAKRILGTANSDILLIDQENNVWFSDNLGNAWRELTIPLEFQNAEFVDLTLATNDVVVIAYESGIISSANQGEDWTIDYSSDTHNIRDVQAGFNGTLFFVNDQPDGLFQRNLGEEWEQIGDGLEGRLLRSVAYDQQGRVYVASESDGIFRAAAPVTDVVSNYNLPLQSIGIRPHPVQSYAILDFGGKREQLRIELRDIRGSKVLEVGVPEPQMQYQLDLADLPSGPYVLQVVGKDYRAESTLQIVR